MRQRRELDFFNTLVHRQTGLGGITPSFLLDFAYGDISSRGVAVTPSFTRATTATFIDQDSMVRTALSGEARFQGLRRVRNLSSTPESTAAWAVAGTTAPSQTSITAEGETYAGVTFPVGGNAFAFSNAVINVGQNAATVLSSTRPLGRIKLFLSRPLVGAESLTVYIEWNGDTGQSLTLTAANAKTTPTVYIIGGTAVTNGATGTASVNLRAYITAGNSLTAPVSLYAKYWQVEDATGQAVPVPAEYLSVGVLSAPYQGANVDGVRYFPWHNGNVVQQNGSLRSQELDNAGVWSTTNCSVLANQIAAPDGTLTADKMVEDGTNSGKLLRDGFAPAGGQWYTFSVYAKAAQRTWLSLGVSSAVLIGGAGIATYFNLGTGVVGSIGDGGASGSTTTMTPAGNGWYRCSVTFKTQAAPAAIGVFMQIVLGDLGSSYQGDSTSGLYLWGAQTQPGRRAGTYVATTSAAVTNNIVEEARGDPITTSSTVGIGYFCEFSRTNLLLQSEDFSTTWAVSAATVSINQTAAPDGNTTADAIVDTAANANHDVSQAVAKAASALAYSYVVYAKAGTKTSVLLQGAEGTNGAFASFNLSTGAVIDAAQGFGAAPFTAMSHAITALANGWYRCELRFTTGTGVSLALTNRITNAAYLGDGLGTIFLWGAQLEQAAFASSYIPTTVATVTRNTDQLRYPTAPWYRDAGWTWAATFGPDEGFEVTNHRIVADVSASIAPITQTATNQAGSFDGSAAVASGAGSAFTAGQTKVATSGDSTGRSAIMTGTTLGSGAAQAGAMLGATVSIGEQTGGQTFYGTIARVAYWNQRLSDTFLRASVA